MKAKSRIMARLARQRQKTGQDVLDTMGAHPIKADLIEAAELMGLEVPEGATNPQIAELILSIC